MIGYIRPPVHDPDAAMPIANARFFEKYVESRDIVGQNISPLPIPVHSPCAKNSCQYWVQSEVMNIPDRCRQNPVTKMGRKRP